MIQLPNKHNSAINEITENLLLQMYVYNYCKLTEFFLLKITGMGCMNTVLLLSHSKTFIFIENAPLAFLGTGVSL